VKDLSESVETLGKKADALIQAIRSTRAKLESLEAENQKLRDKSSLLNEEYNKLKDENKVLRMASAIRGEGDNVTETKRKISQMVREIDKCIAKLND
jgi:cell division protein FtsB